jgi:acetyl-CoA acetyltransferase
MNSKPVRIVGVGRTPLGRLGLTATQLALNALDGALASAGMSKHDVHGLIAIPSLANPHFMQAHHFATVTGLIQANQKMVLRTIDTGGAGPISAMATAVNMIRMDWCETVAIVASDAVLSLQADEFLRRADESVEGCKLPSPSIPHGYDTYARYQMREFGVTREQLAMVPVLMSHMAARHPDALCRKPYTLSDILTSRTVAPVTSLLECARRADGGAAIILASERHYRRSFPGQVVDRRRPVVVSVGEASGPLFPPSDEKDITPALFSCERAAKRAYSAAQLGPQDIGFFGLYDCFPICLIRALEAVGLCPVGEGGAFIEKRHAELMQRQRNGEDVLLPPESFPINTHGGLQCFGAPWEVPAMYNILEAVCQLGGEAGARQVIPRPKRALVYGNGGIFSASAVAILGDGEY